MKTLDDVSKFLSDSLRKAFPPLKASHARELVAAFFGYKTHAALLVSSRRAEFSKFQNTDLLQKRLATIQGLPENLPGAEDLAKHIAAIYTSGANHQ